MTFPKFSLCKKRRRSPTAPVPPYCTEGPIAEFRAYWVTVGAIGSGLRYWVAGCHWLRFLVVLGDIVTVGRW